MKFWLGWLIGIGIFVGLIVGAGLGAQHYFELVNKPVWRTVEVAKGDITYSVNATGKVQPLHKVTVGSVVSGAVVELLVDFNDRVKEGQLMARIDTRIYDAAVRRDEALLSTSRAQLLRVEALLEQAKNDEVRARDLRSVDENFISETELDSLRFSRIAREAEVAVSKTAIDQSEANLQNSQANLEYTRIVAPCDGIIIDRKIDSGQTIAASFQTPELFIVAPELDKFVHIVASVDEADIGLIRDAQLRNQKVSFTVDAHPDEIFTDGLIQQIRLSSTESQNVITYPVIVKTPNDTMKLLPGMTANLSFQIESKKDVVKIPNAAMRFYPDKKFVHPDDQKILEGSTALMEEAKDMMGKQSAEDKFGQSHQRRNRHVWVVEGELLRAKQIVTGISDNRFTELVSGDLKPGDRLVNGEEPKQ